MRAAASALSRAASAPRPFHSALSLQAVDATPETWKARKEGTRTASGGTAMLVRMKTLVTACYGVTWDHEGQRRPPAPGPDPTDTLPGRDMLSGHCAGAPALLTASRRHQRHLHRVWSLPPQPREPEHCALTEPEPLSTSCLSAESTAALPPSRNAPPAPGAFGGLAGGSATGVPH